MKLVEKFISINGEGRRAGELAVFIRFKGCNMQCSYCDTMWANVAEVSYTEVSPKEIADYILESGVNNVTITGGEPLLQEEMKELLSLLLDGSYGNKNLRIEIETNGSIDLKAFDKLRHDCTDKLTFTMDYKLPSSKCESFMNINNFSSLRYNDTVKMVVGNYDDLVRAKEIIEDYKLIDKCNSYISPVWDRIKMSDIVDFMIENKMNGVRLQVQMHKIIWDPDKRGV